MMILALMIETIYTECLKTMKIKKKKLNLKEGKCINLESLYNEFIKPPLEKEKKGITLEIISIKKINL